MNPDYTEFRFPQIKPHTWTRVFRQRTPQDAIDFVASLLVYESMKRPKPLEALLHPFFDQLRDQSCRLPNGDPLPELFNFSTEEINSAGPELIERLTPSWYK